MNETPKPSEREILPCVVVAIAFLILSAAHVAGRPTPVRASPVLTDAPQLNGWELDR